MPIQVFQLPSPSTLSITTGLQSSEYKDVTIGPGFHPVHSPFHSWASAAGAVALLDFQTWYKYSR